MWGKVGGSGRPANVVPLCQLKNNFSRNSANFPPHFYPFLPSLYLFFIQGSFYNNLGFCSFFEDLGTKWPFFLLFGVFCPVSSYQYGPQRRKSPFVNYNLHFLPKKLNQITKQIVFFRLTGSNLMIFYNGEIFVYSPKTHIL